MNKSLCTTHCIKVIVSNIYGMMHNLINQESWFLFQSFLNLQLINYIYSSHLFGMQDKFLTDSLDLFTFVFFKFEPA